MQTLDIAWLAGLLEGEGCFWNGSNSKKTSSRIGIQLTMTDRDVVEKAMSLLGASRITVQEKSGNRKTQYAIAINGARAAAWMMMVYSFMGGRRKAKIKECLALWRSAPVFNRDKERCKNGHLFTPENTFKATDGQGRIGRGCKTCRSAYMTEWKRKKREREAVTVPL